MNVYLVTLDGDALAIFATMEDARIFLDRIFFQPDLKKGMRWTLKRDQPTSQVWRLGEKRIAINAKIVHGAGAAVKM